MSGVGLEWAPFGFGGGLFDADTGFVRLGRRDFDTHTGRWTSKDPTLWHGLRANLYAYAANDPINRIDLSGAEDRSWPFNGQITNDSKNTVWGYDYDQDEFVPVPPNSESSNDRDIDYVEVNGEWYKIGPWDFDVEREWKSG